MPRVSIVITSYNRPRLLKNTLASFIAQRYKDYEVIVVDDGTDDQTIKICEQFAHVTNGTQPIKYIHTVREPGSHYSNPAIPNNIGIKAAEGEILIIQNAECQHFGPVIEELTRDISDCNAIFPSVEALTITGGHSDWYIHSVHSPRPFFFCGAVSRKTIVDLGGFDEQYLFYGFDDNDMQDRLVLAGIKFEFRDDIIVKHAWHLSSYKAEDAERNRQNAILYEQKSNDLKYGKISIVRNTDKPWGVLSDASC